MEKLTMVTAMLSVLLVLVSIKVWRSLYGEATVKRDDIAQAYYNKVLSESDCSGLRGRTQLKKGVTRDEG